jgi:recombination protein RecT
LSTEQANRPQITQVMEALSTDTMRNEIASLLPPGVSLDRFTQTTIVAIQHAPDVLGADRQSLYNAISRAAADGLMPDGKEGALVVFNQKFKGRDGKDAYMKVVKWMPMVEGIIKQLGKVGISVYAASVHENDKIEVWHDDTGQHVRHNPDPFKDRGEVIGVFACARVGEVTYVETMNLAEIEAVRAASRSGDSGPWAAWYGRMAQKSVLHRIKKRLPITDDRIVQSLRDPEEDPDVVPVQALPHLGRDEVLETTAADPVKAEPVAAAAPRRPRGLQAVIDKNKPAPAPEPARDPHRGDTFDTDTGEVF